MCGRVREVEQVETVSEGQVQMARDAAAQLEQLLTADEQAILKHFPHLGDRFETDGIDAVKADIEATRQGICVWLAIFG